MKITANAKINLSLDVMGKRDDGYHEVYMIMQEIDLCDTLEIKLNDSGIVHLICDSKETGSETDNIAYKAAEIFLKEIESKHGCDISLSKKIPVCAGLGGGSADAAAVLKALNALCGMPLDSDALLRISLKLGADVPFCIMGGTASARGIGEILTPIGSPAKKWVVLIKPKIDISTAEAYRRMDSAPYPHPDVDRAVCCIQNGDTEGFYKAAGNTFEYVTAGQHSEIGQIKAHLLSHGAEFAMMSGSGPTVYGLFENRNDAQKAFDTYSGSYSGGGVAQLVIKN